MTDDEAENQKARSLRSSRTHHPHPERVVDDRFRAHPFFDPRDGLQVKYEMLRRVRVEGYTVSAAASACGLSRPTYYEVLAAFERHGVIGLLPDKKGPRGGHKLTSDRLDFVDAQLAAQPDLGPAELARRLREETGVEVHPKSISRARRNRAKKKP